MSKFLLLIGPSGVGKSTIIDELQKLDSRFVYISPYMTRPVRQGEKNKVMVSNEKMDEMQLNGELVVVNELYGGIRYGTPRQPIITALAIGDFPVLDWPINRINVMTTAFPNQLFVVYISPPSIEVLQQRLNRDGRDIDGKRFASALSELEKYWSLGFAGLYDFEVVSAESKIHETAIAIRNKYLESI